MAIPHAIRKRDKSETYQLSTPHRSAHLCSLARVGFAFPCRKRSRVRRRRKHTEVATLMPISPCTEFRTKGTCMDKPTRGGATSPVTVLLTNDQTATLDEISAAIRRNTGQAVSRSAILRALAAASLPYGEGWLRCRSEQQITQLVGRLLHIGSTLQVAAK